jgi:serine/threonine protein kinase
MRDIEKETRSLLWRSPELLRDPNPPLRGSQKGDVYSFGIVLYEMIGRSGPWGKCQLTERGTTMNEHEAMLLIALGQYLVPL